MEIYAIKDLKKNKVADFFMEQWGSTEMVISSCILQYKNTESCKEKVHSIAMDNTDSKLI